MSLSSNLIVQCYTAMKETGLLAVSNMWNRPLSELPDKVCNVSGIFRAGYRSQFLTSLQMSAAAFHPGVIHSCAFHSSLCVAPCSPAMTHLPSNIYSLPLDPLLFPSVFCPNCTTSYILAALDEAGVWSVFTPAGGARRWQREIHFYRFMSLPITQRSCDMLSMKRSAVCVSCRNNVTTSCHVAICVYAISGKVGGGTWHGHTVTKTMPRFRVRCLLARLV